MRWFLGTVSILIFLGAFTELGASTTVFQQIMAGILMVIAAIFLIGAAITDAIVTMQKKMLSEVKKFNSKSEAQTER